MVSTNYILCSVGLKPNQNKNEQQIPSPIPRKQQEGMQEVLQSIPIPRALRDTPNLDGHSTLLPTSGSIWYL